MAVLIPDNTISMGGVLVHYYPLTAHNTRHISMPSVKMTSVVGVTIHNTGWIDTASDTTPAEQYTRATVNGNMKSVRVHYYVDNVCAWQNLPLTLTSWHAADGSGNGNMHTISIECIMSGNYSDKDRQSEDNAARLAAELLKTYGLTIDHLYTHTHWLNVRDGKKGTVDELNVMHHNDKMCPAYILPHWQDFKAKVAAYMGENIRSVVPENNAEQIWGRLISAGFTEAGAAGLMGNLKAESNLIANNLQNVFEKKLGYTDESYTAAVDVGTYRGFADDGAGYGLAQWTYHTRKQALLTFAKLRDVSVGDLDMQLDFLLKELQEGYTGLYNLLKITEDVQVASDAVLTQFERPADMSAGVKTRRAEYAKSFYNEFHGAKPSESVQNAADGAFFVRVVCDELNVRKGAGTEFDVVMQVHRGEAYTIVETAHAKDGGIWGRLKSGAGWINIGSGYCRRV